MYLSRNSTVKHCAVMTSKEWRWYLDPETRMFLSHVSALKRTVRWGGYFLVEFHVGLPPKINNTNAGGKNNFTSGEVWIMHEAWRKIRAVLQLQLQHMEHAYLYCIPVRYIWARYNCSSSYSNSSSSSSSRCYRPLSWKRSRLLIALAQLKFHGPRDSNVSTIRRQSI